MIAESGFYISASDFVFYCLPTAFQYNSNRLVFVEIEIVLQEFTFLKMIDMCPPVAR